MATLTFAYDHTRDPMNPDDLADKIATALNLTASPRADINPTQILVGHPNITEANRAAIQTVIDGYVLDPVWRDGTLGVLRRRLQNALATNTQFLAIPSPNAAQVTTQAQNLTRECSAIIKVLLDMTDDARGT